MILLVRLGDIHSCGMPDHGDTPIGLAPSTAKANDFSVARIGDVCGCGAALIYGFPKVLVDGRPAAYIGSPTSHGGTIRSESASRSDAYKVGGDMTDTVIDFQKMGVMTNEGFVDETKLFVLLGDPQLNQKAAARNALIELRSTHIVEDQV